MAHLVYKHPLEIQAERIADEKLFKDCFLCAPPCPDDHKRAALLHQMSQDEVDRLDCKYEIVGRTLLDIEKTLTVRIYESPEDREVSWRIRFATRAAEYLKSRSMRTE